MVHGNIFNDSTWSAQLKDRLMVLHWLQLAATMQPVVIILQEQPLYLFAGHRTTAATHDTLVEGCQGLPTHCQCHAAW
jgi:hypothetical protein